MESIIPCGKQKLCHPDCHVIVHFHFLCVSNFRNINGFLNTGKGGTIYLGIVDDGKVKGLHMTQYQVSIGVQFLQIQ